MAGNAGNWFKVPAGELKGRRVFISNAQLAESSLGLYSKQELQRLLANPPDGRAAAGLAREVERASGASVQPQGQARRGGVARAVVNNVAAPSKTDQQVVARERELFARESELYSQIRRLDEQVTANQPVPGYYNRAENRRRAAEVQRLTAEIAPLRAERTAVMERAELLRQANQTTGAGDRVLAQEIRARAVAGSPLAGDAEVLRSIEERSAPQTPRGTRTERPLTVAARQRERERLIALPNAQLEARMAQAQRALDAAARGGDTRRMNVLRERMRQIREAGTIREARENFAELERGAGSAAAPQAAPATPRTRRRRSSTASTPTPAPAAPAPARQRGGALTAAIRQREVARLAKLPARDLNARMQQATRQYAAAVRSGNRQRMAALEERVRMLQEANQARTFNRPQRSRSGTSKRRLRRQAAGVLAELRRFPDEL